MVRMAVLCENIASDCYRCSHIGFSPPICSAFIRKVALYRYSLMYHKMLRHSYSLRSY